MFHSPRWAGPGAQQALPAGEDVVFLSQEGATCAISAWSSYGSTRGEYTSKEPTKVCTHVFINYQRY